MPPPRHIDLRSGQDPGWQWGNTNSPRDTGFGGNRLATVRPGSSLYGGAIGSYPREPSVDMFSPAREPSVSRSVDGMSEHSNTSEDDRSSQNRPSLGNHRYGSLCYTSLRLIEQFVLGFWQGLAALECLCLTGTSWSFGGFPRLPIGPAPCQGLLAFFVHTNLALSRVPSSD